MDSSLTECKILFSTITTIKDSVIAIEKFNAELPDNLYLETNALIENELGFSKLTGDFKLHGSISFFMPVRFFNK